MVGRPHAAQGDRRRGGRRCRRGDLQRGGLPLVVVRRRACAAQPRPGVDDGEGRTGLPRDHRRPPLRRARARPQLRPRVVAARERVPDPRRATRRTASPPASSLRPCRSTAHPSRRTRWSPGSWPHDELCCQLFSEPGAGSDLASLGCRATRDGDEWVINGQKVWSSGAQFSQWGELIARHDPDVAKHKGMTAFIIPMDLAGHRDPPDQADERRLVVQRGVLHRRPDARHDAARARSARGGRWRSTTLGFERDHSDCGPAAARAWADRGGSCWPPPRQWASPTIPCVRQELMRVYTHHRVEGFLNRRAADLRRSGAPPGPEGSLGKLLWTEGMNLMSDVVSSVLGAQPDRRHRRVGHVRMGRARARRPRLSHRRRLRRDTAQHHRRARARPAGRAAGRQGRRLEGHPEVAPSEPALPAAVRPTCVME